MAPLFLPVLSHFENKNRWSSSAGRLRYLITPHLAPLPKGMEEADGAPPGSTLTVEVWEGPWAYEFSTVEHTETFPLTQEGLNALPPFLQTWQAAMDARPERALAENIARRDAAEAARKSAGEDPAP